MTNQKAFASTGDLAEKQISFTEVGADLFAYTAQGDPNTGVIIGDDSCAVFDAQATPGMARHVVDKVRSVTDKRIKYVILSHYHAVRVLRCFGVSGAGDRWLAGNASANCRTWSAGLGIRIRSIPATIQRCRKHSWTDLAEFGLYW